MLNQHYEHTERYQVILRNTLLASKKNTTAYYHKNIHLNDTMETPFSKNLFLSFLLTHSDNIPRVRKRANKNDPRDNVVYAKISYNHRANNAKPYRSPNPT